MLDSFLVFAGPRGACQLLTEILENAGGAFDHSLLTGSTLDLPYLADEVVLIGLDVVGEIQDLERDDGSDAGDQETRQKHDHQRGWNTANPPSAQSRNCRTQHETEQNGQGYGDEDFVQEVEGRYRPGNHSKRDQGVGRGI